MTEAVNTPVNALGEPAPNRTDFTQWARDTLERFAREAADENLVLRTQVADLKEDVAAALAAWRQCTARGVPAAGQAPQRGDWRTWDVRGTPGVEVPRG